MDAPYTAPAYKNRKTGLTLFGIALIGMGALCFLIIPVIALSQLAAAKMGQANFRMVLPSLLVYGALAFLFVTLGIGSIKGRRWARAVTLVLSWAWLVIGIISLLMFIWFVPAVLNAIAEMESEPLPPAARTIIIAIGACFVGFFFVLIPALLVLFYGSSHVKATVETMDPHARWTDACPLPVLAVSLLLTFAVWTLLTMPIGYNGAIPLFGTIASGFVGNVMWVVLAALLGYAAWSLYRLRLTGWWIVLFLLMIFTISNVVTFSRVTLMDLYRAMDYPEDQLELIEKMNIFTPTQIVVWSVLWVLPLIGYLLFIKKYLRGNDSPPPASA